VGREPICGGWRKVFWKCDFFFFNYIKIIKNNKKWESEKTKQKLVKGKK
jgi:hypothetical protein